MKLILLTTPSFFGSQSMPRYARMLGEGMRRRGHSVVYRTAPPLLSRILSRFPGTVRKWSGYIDQYLLFPSILRGYLRTDTPRSLYVVTDQGLGIWVPLLADRCHAVHCHDLFAIRSALGEFPENHLMGSGKLYQRMILSGLRKGRNFISVSESTRESLERIIGIPRGISTVVPNALHRPVVRFEAARASQILGIAEIPDDRRPILHVGGNQWYKNRGGLLRLYERYALSASDPRPLWMAGPEPTRSLRAQHQKMPCRDLVKFIIAPDDQRLDACYSLAVMLLHPSLEEGFGWPVAEALAHGCPVVTTAIPPMTQVGGKAAFYIPRMPCCGDLHQWAEEGAKMIQHVMGLTATERSRRILAGQIHASGFGGEQFLDACELAYRQILDQQG